MKIIRALLTISLLSVVATGSLGVSLVGNVHAAASSEDVQKFCGNNDHSAKFDACVQSLNTQNSFRANDINVPESSFDSIVQGVASVIGFFAGALSAIFIVVGGIKYATSDGSPDKIQGAKQTLVYAVAGLIISILAPLIIGFVISRLPQ
jgi:hypothetical protein